MTTKKELQEEYDKELIELNKELDISKKEHKEKFIEEDKLDEKRREDFRIISEQKELIYSKKWEGNFGNRDNWYHGIIPQEFNFNEEDKEFISEALKELSIEKEKEIVETKEYKEITKKYDELICSKFSKEHKELHNKIEDITRSIEWINRKLNLISTKGGLIQESKRLKNIQRHEEKNKKRKEKIQKYKELIINKSQEVKK